MPTMKNSETGETMEMTTEELMEAMREGKISIQQQVHHADGTVTSSTIYGNEIGDGIDRSMNVFGTMPKILPSLKNTATLYNLPLTSNGIPATVKISIVSEVFNSCTSAFSACANNKS